MHAAAGSPATAQRACRRGELSTPLHGNSPTAWPGCSCSAGTAGSGAPHQGSAGGADASWVATGCVRPPRQSSDNHSCGTDTGGDGGHLDSAGSQPFGSCGRDTWGIRLEGWSWMHRLPGPRRVAPHPVEPVGHLGRAPVALPENGGQFVGDGGGVAAAVAADRLDRAWATGWASATAHRQGQTVGGG